MTRAKRGSRILHKAERRLEGIQSIDPTLSLGADLSVSAYVALIAEFRQQLAAYNMALSKLDALHHEMEETERRLADYSQQILLGIGAYFGVDSAEYEMAGGVRKSERKRPLRKALVITASQGD